jgi:hypothetical protein
MNKNILVFSVPKIRRNATSFLGSRNLEKAATIVLKNINYYTLFCINIQFFVLDVFKTSGLVISRPAPPSPVIPTPMMSSQYLILGSNFP